jgi:hypothetical protein
MSTLAIMSAASAAATSSTSALKGAESARSSAIGGVWEGHYTCAQGLTGLDLKISGPGSRGSLSATFSFYPLPSNPDVPVGIYTMRGTYHSASRIVLSGRRWVLAPPGYVMVGLSGRLSGGTFHGTVHGPSCTTFSLRKPTGHPAPSDVVGTWKGSYLGCAQGPTGLRLVVKRKRHTTNQLNATFNFYALPGNPAVPSGSYAMTGYYFPGGVALNGTHWIHQPPGYVFVNLVGNPPRSGGKRFSGAAVGCSTFSLKRS